jgi:hypothetical protein
MQDRRRRDRRRHRSPSPPVESRVLSFKKYTQLLATLTPSSPAPSSQRLPPVPPETVAQITTALQHLNSLFLELLTDDQYASRVVAARWFQANVAQVEAMLGRRHTPEARAADSDVEG